MHKCQGCGVEKDMDQLEISPYADEDHLTDSPINPLLYMDCQDNTRGEPFRQVLVCHECFHKLTPDMWISRNCWEQISPVVPFADLPLLKPVQNV